MIKELIDPKSLLQQKLHQRKAKPIYKLISSSNINEGKTYPHHKVLLFINDEKFSFGEGKSIKLAEQKAAEIALNIMLKEKR